MVFTRWFTLLGVTIWWALAHSDMWGGIILPLRCVEQLENRWSVIRNIMVFWPHAQLVAVFSLPYCCHITYKRQFILVTSSSRTTAPRRHWQWFSYSDSADLLVLNSSIREKERKDLITQLSKFTVLFISKEEKLPNNNTNRNNKQK